MVQCNHIDFEKQEKYILDNPTSSIEDALQFARCSDAVVFGQTRCAEHGGGDILTLYSRDLRADLRTQFTELFKNMISKHGVDDTDLYQLHLVAAACRELIMSHDSDAGDILKHTGNTMVIGKELNFNPRDNRIQRMEIKTDIKQDAEQIELIVQERLKLSTGE